MRLSRRAAIGAVLCVLGFGPAAQAHEFKVGDLVIHHPWSPPTGASASEAAGYMEITNTGAVDDRLVAASAAISPGCRLQEVKTDGVVMTFVELKDGLVIPAGATVVLKPGAPHVAMLGVTAHPKLKTMFAGTLTFARAGKVAVRYFVQEAK